MIAHPLVLVLVAPIGILVAVVIVGTAIRHAMEDLHTGRRLSELDRRTEIIRRADSSRPAAVGDPFQGSAALSSTAASGTEVGRVD